MNLPVELHGVSKAFTGIRALSDVSFDVRPGEVHALLGENGAGKSTLIKIMAGLHQADEGELWVTSQGRDRKGGNSVSVFQVRIIAEETLEVKKTAMFTPANQNSAERW